MKRIRIHLIRIRIIILGWKPVWIRIQGFDDQKLKIIWPNKFFGIKNNNLPPPPPSLGLHKERPSYRRSLQLSKENIQYFKTLIFQFFLLLWVIFVILDPDTDSESEFRIRSWNLSQQCYGAKPLWYVSGSLDPYTGLRNRILFLLAVAFKIPRKMSFSKVFFAYF